MLPANGGCLRVHELWKFIGEAQILRDVSLCLENGTAYLLQGPNGSGKSTLLACIAGLFEVSSGGVQIGPAHLDPSTPGAKRLIGYAPDFPSIDLELSVDEYLRLLAGLHRLKNVDQSIRLMAEEFALADILAIPLNRCSRGMAKRVAVAAALLHEPQMLLLDEPESGLDSGGQRQLIDTLLRRLRSGGTLLIATHQAGLYGPLAPQTITLLNGAVCGG